MWTHHSSIFEPVIRLCDFIDYTMQYIYIYIFLFLFSLHQMINELLLSTEEIYFFFFLSLHQLSFFRIFGGGGVPDFIQLLIVLFAVFWFMISVT